MRLIHRKWIALLLIFILGFSQTVSAVSNADTVRVFKRVCQDAGFMPQLYQTVPLYEDLYVTKTAVDSKIKEVIKTVLDFAEVEKESGKLNVDNMKARLTKLTVDRALSMEAVYIALCMDAFSEETVASLMEGKIPVEFEPLYEAIAEEAVVILGFQEKGEPTHVFDDLVGYEWAEKAIAHLFDRDILNGISDFVFSPSATVTREQFAKMVCVAFQIEAATELPSFSDVAEDAWFYPYVSTMASRKLIQGIGEGMFGSGQNITRQDMAVLMFRIGETLGVFERSNAKKTDFADDRYIASYAKTAVVTLKELGIITGNELNCFNPTMSATRAEAAQMLYRCYEFVNKVNK